jgi:hypothetical protein
MAIYFADSRATGNDDGSSWDDAFVDLCDACSAATEVDDEIWCKWCVFELTNTPTVLTGVYLYGGFPNYLNGTNGDIDFRPYRTMIDGQGTYRCLTVRVDFGGVDGIDLKRGTATEGGGILVYSPGV